MKRFQKAFALLATLALLLSLSGLAATGVAAGGPKVKDNAVRDTGSNYNDGAKLPLKKGDKINPNAPSGPAQIGDTRLFLGLDDMTGAINLKLYTLRGVGEHGEVWVANNLLFPNPNMLNPLTEDPNDFFTYNDCRNLDPSRITITDEQVQYLLDEFDNNIYPTEAEWWGTPPERNGNKALLPKLLPNIKGLGINVPQSHYVGEGDNVVILIDNVRDSNFYDQDNQDTLSYIAGFYWSVFDDYFDRTVMSIDAWDWIHRTGATPPDDGSSDPCTSSPARPYLYEGVFAHEYHHLLHHYTDPDEVNWVNEGLADFSEIITGYADLSVHVDEIGYEGHTQCYLGWVSVATDANPIPRACGPENGLTAWEDQGDDEILADYGFAMFFMNYLNSQGYGQEFFNAWFENPLNGIAGLNDTLADVGSDDTFQSLFEDAIISALIDGYLDNGATGAGSEFQNMAAEATIYFSPEANSTPGAPPWGADYIDLGLGSALDSVVFNGDDTFDFPAGPEWVVDGDGYLTTPDVGETGEYGSDFDVDIARSVSGHDGEVLTFEHYYAMETGWDFGFVQVSTDEGDSWQSLACSGTTTSHDPGALATIVDNVPGFSGPSADDTVTTTIGTAAAPVSVTCPALPAGSDYISFRLMTDELAHFDGWHVRNIELNGAPLGDGTLAGWDNQASFNPTELTFGFALVGINGTVDAFGDIEPGGGESVLVFRPDLAAGQSYTLTAEDLAALSGFDRVVAVIWGIPDEESSTLYQPYSLLVNGAERADGATPA